MNKIRLLFALILSLSPLLSWAQEKHDAKLYFYYICHDRQTNVQSMTRELQQEYDNLKEYENPGIFYLANNEEPIIVKVNLPGENEKDFPHLIGEIQEKLAHDISADFDVNRILSLFSDSPFADAQGRLLYNEVNWNYYVTSTFWSMTYNESVIGALYWIFEMDKLRSEEEFYINILRSTHDVISFEENQAVGEKNYNGINDNFAIVTY